MPLPMQVCFLAHPLCRPGPSPCPGSTSMGAPPGPSPSQLTAVQPRRGSGRQQEDSCMSREALLGCHVSLLLALPHLTHHMAHFTDVGPEA